jgi:hypothetical protein
VIGRSSAKLRLCRAGNVTLQPAPLRISHKPNENARVDQFITRQVTAAAKSTGELLSGGNRAAVDRLDDPPSFARHPGVTRRVTDDVVNGVSAVESMVSWVRIEPTTSRFQFR